MSASRNLGISRSAGDLVAFIDSDDIWRPAKLTEQVSLLDAHRKLAMALVTLPGISSANREAWGGEWCWSFGEQSARRLFGDTFGARNVSVETFGNVYAATCFLHGLAAEEVNREWLNDRDSAYPVTVTVRAQR